MNKKFLRDTIILPSSYESIDETEMEYIFGRLSNLKAFGVGIIGNILHDIGKRAGTAVLKRFGPVAIGGAVSWSILDHYCCNSMAGGKY